MSKVIRDCIGFALLRSVIGLENSRHPLNQSDAKVKPIATWSLAFSRAYDRLPVFSLSSHWLPLKFSFVLIGHYDYFGFGFTTLNRKALYSDCTVIKERSSVNNTKTISVQMNSQLRQRKSRTFDSGKRFLDRTVPFG